RATRRARCAEFTGGVTAPFEKGWFGALLKGKDPLKPDQPTPAAIEAVYRGTPAADAGLKVGDVIVSVDGVAAPDRTAVAKMISAKPRGSQATLVVKRGDAEETVKITVPEPDISIYVAGEPRLYGWVYSYAGDVFWIFTVTWCFEW